MNRLRVFWGLAYLIPFVCFGSQEKLSPDLANVDPQATVRVIVQFATPPTAQDRQRVLQLGGDLEADLDLVNAGLYSVPAVALKGLANNPNVVYISPDREVTATLDYANPTVQAQVAQQYGWTGTGVGIAVIDSGIQSGPDLLDNTITSSNVSRIVYSQSFIPRNTSAADQYGHGTHVAGIAAGNGAASTGSNYF